MTDLLDPLFEPPGCASETAASAPPPRPGSGPASPAPGGAGVPAALEVAAGTSDADDERCASCGVDPCACPEIARDAEIESLPAHPEPEPVLSPSTPPAASLGINSVEGPADEGFIAAAIDRRAALQAKHGAMAVTDLSRSTDALARDLKDRAMALADRLSMRDPDPDAARTTLATIGALALALHEKLETTA